MMKNCIGLVESNTDSETFELGDKIKYVYLTVGIFLILIVIADIVHIT